MSIQDFIKDTYGTRTSGVGTGEKGSARALTLKEARAETARTAKQVLRAKRDKERPTLKLQLEGMRSRRADYDLMKTQGVISTTKQGMDLLSKIGDKSTRPEVVRHMAKLNDAQLNSLTEVFNRRVSSMGGLSQVVAQNIYKNMLKNARELRGDTGLSQQKAQVDTTLGFNAKDLITRGVDLTKPLYDKKGFDLDVNPTYVGFKFRKQF
jgi:hypothetical protein|tara:strand:- start:209 stop:835 length:627 start_codon:yes stop_codon:yes gene_type:complete